jgi:hypothetical protein
VGHEELALRETIAKLELELMRMNERLADAEKRLAEAKRESQRWRELAVGGLKQLVEARHENHDLRIRLDGSPSFSHTCGDFVCEHCGKEFRRHKDYTGVMSYDGQPFLTELCDGSLVKL